MRKDGTIGFHPSDTGRQMGLPCGKCIGCKLEFSRQWALRCVHEAKQHDENSWLTLTYNDKELEEHCYAGSLVKPHLQKFLKRLRRRNEEHEIRYYACGEYGENTERPHFHICLFGFDFSDKYFWRRSDSGEDIYRSDELESLWEYGNSEIGDMTFESAAYTARYCVKKISGEMAVEHYTKILLDGRMVEIEPEFSIMSLKPGIGAKHFEQFRDDIYPEDECIVRGARSKPPRYYDKLLEEADIGLYTKVKSNRQDYRESHTEDETLQRRTDREIVKKAQVSQLARSLEKL